MVPTENVLDSVLKKLEAYKTVNPPEKIYVHTDKELYTNGETIWFKTYLVNGVDHLLSDKSKVVYVDLLDEKDSIVAHRKLYSGTSGASGDILLDNELKQGTYLLRSYTKYMLDQANSVLFEKEIPIWNQKISQTEIYGPKIETTETVNSLSEKKEVTNQQKINKPTLRFYPEGGNLVTGLTSVLGIKAEDENGNGIELQGTIYDSKGNSVALFRTYKFGLGKTQFTPKKGETYTAEINTSNSEVFRIPTPLEKGYVLGVKNNTDHMLLEIATNIKGGLKNVALLGHIRGSTFFKYVEQSEKKQVHTVKLVYRDIQDGVVHFTLFTPDGKPICERLTFVDNPENDHLLTLKSNKNTYGFREKVMLDVSITDANKKNPIEGDFSISVVDKNTKNENGIRPANIESWLLLDSDIGGSVVDPNYFFVEEKKQQRKYVLDVLMLTHGWRRFLWTDFIKNDLKQTPILKGEQGIMVTGKTRKFNNKYAIKPGLVTLNILNDGIFQEKKETDKLGIFSFGPYVFTDTLKAVIQGKSFDKDKISIQLDPIIPLSTPNRLKKKKPLEVDLKMLESFLEDSKQKKIAGFRYDAQAVELDVVQIKGKVKTRQEIIDEKIEDLVSYGTPSDRLFTDSIPGTEAASVIDLLARVGGVQIRGAYPNQRIIIRGVSSFVASSDPLFLLDGSPIPADIFSNMQASEISFIDVLKGADAAFYGTRGTNGVVAAYTYNFNTDTSSNEPYPGVTNFSIEGFYSAKEFYKPNYSVQKEAYAKPDYRSTLYWEPFLKNKELAFFTGDKEGSYVVYIEGLTNKGQPIKGTYEFDIIDKVN